MWHRDDGVLPSWTDVHSERFSAAWVTFVYPLSNGFQEVCDNSPPASVKWTVNPTLLEVRRCVYMPVLMCTTAEACVDLAP